MRLSDNECIIICMVALVKAPNQGVAPCTRSDKIIICCSDKREARDKLILGDIARAGGNLQLRVELMSLSFYTRPVAH